VSQLHEKIVSLNYNSNWNFSSKLEIAQWLI